jgi:hypothetical protein
MTSLRSVHACYYIVTVGGTLLRHTIAQRGTEQKSVDSRYERYPLEEPGPRYTARRTSCIGEPLERGLDALRR